MAAMKIYGVGTSVLACRVVAAWAGAEVEVVPFTDGVTNRTPEFLAKSPLGKVPLLETKDGCIFETGAICRYLALTGPKGASLYPASEGPGDIARCKVDGWLDWSATLSEITAALVYPILGVRPYDAGLTKEAEKKLDETLTALEAHLSASPFLAGPAASLADVVAAVKMLLLFVTVMDKAERDKRPKVTAWLANLLAAPATQSVLGAPVAGAARRYAYTPSSPTPWGDGPSPAEALVPCLTQEWTMHRVRQTFIDFMSTKAHTPWPSSAVVPHNDPTLLFTNAGMNQYKAIFLGQADPATELAKLKRAANSQKCIRAGGKHNDLDDVGKDNYHHTFFEMLGNWSFGDFFKEGAIDFAWELLTSVFHLPPDRIYATYFGGDAALGLPPDEEARKLWLRFLPEQRVIAGSVKDNFWEMGDQGPCGPASELHFDRIGGRSVPELVNQDDPNVLEIWNLVFIQFNREADGSLRPLPAKHVDTGMGLERLVSVLQDKKSNYATDVFSPLFAAIQAVTGFAKPYGDTVGKDDPEGVDMAYRVVADHIRTLSFAIADGARPGPEGRDYVLRRILRRAVRYGRERLNAPQGFFSQLVGPLVDHMGSAYPELVAARQTIFDIISEEEVSFSRTLNKGIEQFKKFAEAVPAGGMVSGPDAFLLWDTYGFPVDLTELMAEERGLRVDMDGFAVAMKEAKERSRAARKTGGGPQLKFEAEATGALKEMNAPLTNDAPKYDWAPTQGKVVAILTLEGYRDTTEGVDGPVGLVLDATAFYAESGGQVADTGRITTAAGATLEVTDCQVAAGYVLHKGDVAGDVAIRVGDSVTAEPDLERRKDIAPNHTFTHVLNYALRKVVGDGVDQKGSIVQPERLRFDFSHGKPVSPEQLAEVEQICRDALAAALPVHNRELPLATAQSINGLRAIFGEAYPDPVRVVSVGRAIDDLVADPAAEGHAGYSIEFCGGTHLKNTSEAEAFCLISEEGIAKGVRRVIAVTRGEAKKAVAEGERLLAALEEAKKLEGQALSDKLSALRQDVDGAVMSAGLKGHIREEMSKLTKIVMEAAKAAAAAAKKEASANAVKAADAAAAAGQPFVAMRMDGIDGKTLGEAFVAITKAHADMCALFVSADADKGKVLALAGVPESVQAKLKANDWVKWVLEVLGGKGGGKPGLAQGTGPNMDKADEALEAGKKLAGEALA
ncbi:unnamed protein product [Pedinophyceae sp. YPF-701]|nr:unnamed protein product [Pedinophyceae sp. YPF-701]